MSNLEIAKKVCIAWCTKDITTLQEYLHDNYEFTGPMTGTKTKEQSIECVQSCNFESSIENCEVIEQNNKLVHAFDMVITAPLQSRIPTVEIMEFENGKVIKSRMFFDTALFPQAEKGSCCDTNVA
ncbi:MAG: hypothetical protein OXR68_02250 [Alphaproteobacteria bacterium]|nr:hypothetical protein [Alphaproteobacteria bacterium]MDD9919432.1 hypothetical protein [Alphaproteobacteria bacterium]